MTVMAGLREVVERKGVFCALYSDRGSHFWLTPKVGGKVDPHRLTQVGRALRELGIQMIPAYSPQARGRSERNFGTWQGRLPQELRLHGSRRWKRPMRFCASTTSPSSTAASRCRRRSGAARFWRCRSRDLDSDLLAAVRAHGESRQHGELSESALADRSGALASHAGGLPGDGASASGWHPSLTHGPHRLGRYTAAGQATARRQNAGATGCGKDARWKSHKADFPTSLGNPANPAGFPLSHSPDGCWSTLKPDISCAKKTGHFNLLRTVKAKTAVKRLNAGVKSPGSILLDKLAGMNFPARQNKLREHLADDSR